MKKTVILILVLLPILLVVTIAFAGKILSHYHHIPVERVEFVDDVGDAWDDEKLFKVNVGETKKAAVRVFPDMASNPMVSFTVQDETICTVDAEGNVTGVAIGSTMILVTTSEGNKTDMLNVLVVAEKVTGVTLPYSELTLIQGEIHNLLPEVVPHTALDKTITFTSDDPAVVSVKQTGQIKAEGVGTATITVTTQDGGFTATCLVTVESGTPALSFDIPGIENRNGVYVVKDYSLDLAPYLSHDDTKIPDLAAIRWEVISGGGYASMTDSTLSFTMAKKLVTVRIYVGDKSAPTYFTDVRFFLEP